jgi:hypothetical protein
MSRVRALILDPTSPEHKTVGEVLEGTVRGLRLPGGSGSSERSPSSTVSRVPVFAPRRPRASCGRDKPSAYGCPETGTIPTMVVPTPG